MLFGKTDQSIHPDGLAIVRRRRAVIAAKHLVYLAAEHFEIGFGDAFHEGNEFKIQSAVGRGHFPRVFVADPL